MSLSAPDSAVLPWAFALYLGLGLPVLGWFGVSKSWAVLFIIAGAVLVACFGVRTYRAGTMVVVSKNRQRRAQLAIASIVFAVLALTALGW